MQNTDAKDRLFLVVLKADTPGDLATGARRLLATAERVSGRRQAPAFTAADGGTIGIYLRARAFAAQIRAAFAADLALRGAGFVLVLELGQDWAAEGNSSGWRHLQALARG